MSQRRATTSLIATQSEPVLDYDRPLKTRCVTEQHSWAPAITVRLPRPRGARHHTTIQDQTDKDSLMIWKARMMNI